MREDEDAMLGAGEAEKTPEIFLSIGEEEEEGERARARARARVFCWDTRPTDVSIDTLK